MNYTEFENAIYQRIADNWDETDATLIAEYRAKEVDSDATLEVSIGVESDEETLGTFDGDTKNMNIQTGTVNLRLSFASNIGSETALDVIEKARALFHNYVSGYIKFSGAQKRNFGTIDGRIIKVIICPFSVEIIE